MNRSILTPSLLSGLLVTLAGLVLVVGTVAAVRFPNSSLQFLLHENQAREEERSLSDSYDEVYEDLEEDSFVSNIPLMVLWGCVGLFAYLFTLNIATIFKNAQDFRSELGYVKTDRKKLAKTALEKFLFRVALAGIWVLFIKFSLNMVLPYAIAASHVAGWWEDGLLNSIGYGFLAFLIVVTCLHIHTILMRLIFLRSRLF